MDDMVKLGWVWSLYIVRASDGSLYAGITTDVDRRVREHNYSQRGAKALRGKRPVELEWRSRHQYPKSAALVLEHTIKKLTHEQKEKLIAGIGGPLGGDQW